ncbi:MAG: hypothetical protein IT186_05065 [Acidobacteria bacterium]|nr:hypothetical protein [Acidobacteriota bacterium]
MAVIVTEWFEAVDSDVTRKVPVVEPTGIEMLSGTVAALVRLLVRITVVAEVTGLWSLTTPLTPLPPGFVALFRVRSYPTRIPGIAAMEASVLSRGSVPRNPFAVERGWNENAPAGFSQPHRGIVSLLESVVGTPGFEPGTP